MLIKTKLRKLPLPGHPNLETQKGELTAQASVTDGIYQFAIWRSEKFIGITYSDGKNVINYSVGTDSWNSGIIEEWEYRTNETKESIKITEGFFKARYCYRSISAINGFIREKRDQGRREAAEKRREIMMNRIESFPKDPEGLYPYCEQYVFRKKYALLKKGDPKRKQEQCKCLACGKEFICDGKRRHKQIVTCPECNEPVQLVAERYLSTTKEKAIISVLFKNDKEEILMRQETIERRFNKKGEPVYGTDIFYWRIDQKDGASHRYYYGCTYYGDYNYRPDNYMNKDKIAFVYADGLNEIIKTGVDLEKLKLAGAVDLDRLITRVRNTETARTLYKLGLYHLAERWELEEKQTVGTFEEELGVNLKYYPIMKLLNVSPETVRWMQEVKIHLHDEQIRKMHKLMENAGCGFHGGLRRMQQYMGIERIINYLYKQHLLHPKKQTATLVDWYNDYRSMATQLNEQMDEKRKIDMTKSAFIMPRDIKAAHDGISAKLTVIKDRSKDRIIRKIGQRMARNKSFTYKDLTVVYPVSIEDFILEGTALKHCVGNNSTYRNGQADGSLLTIFIRRVDAIDKPYQTATFYPKNEYSLKETYGSEHKVATKEISEFIKKYQEFMRAAAQRAA